VNARRLRTIAQNVALVVAGLIVGAVLGVLIVAPATADIYNACVADKVVPRAGLPGDVIPGPANNPYTDPRSRWTTPPPWTPSRAPDATPRVVTPVQGQ
jgi:hypothetical protein